MGSENRKDLKTYVRYDGNGRVVAGSLVFRKKKPKNGRWQEVTKNECCNFEPNPTTTTTTTNGGGVTPTAFVQSYFLNTYNACNSTTDGTLVFYSASSTIQAGITVFTDAALTIPVTAGWVILTQPQPMQYVRYLVGQGGVLSAFDCSQLYYSLYKGFSQSGICTSSFSTYVTFSTGSSIIVGQTIVYENGIPFQVNPGIPAYITFPQLGYAIYEMAVGGIIIATTGSCETTTTTTTTSAPINYIADVYGIADSACYTQLASNESITTSTPVTVGKWYTPSSTSTVAYNIMSLGGSGGFVETLINERDTCNTFTDDITWSDTACFDSAGSFLVSGNGTTFCNSTVLTAPEFEFLSVGSHIVTTFEGQTYTVSTNGSIFATVTSACTSC